MKKMILHRGLQKTSSPSIQVQGCLRDDFITLPGVSAAERATAEEILP